MRNRAIVCGTKRVNGKGDEDAAERSVVMGIRMKQREK
jgi:hypothetical protein